MGSVPKIFTDSPIWIDRIDELKALAEVLSCQLILGVDTESNSLFAYQEQVCLVQISTNQVDYLIDSLNIHDLSPLAPIFANPSIEKVFHAAEYDLLCLRRDFGFQFANLFDTMLAARILGKKKVGLGDILSQEFGISVDKRFQRADWGQRPLPTSLIDYARLDSHYLIPLRHRLKSCLEETGRWPLAQEDFHRLCKIDYTPTDEPGKAVCRVNGAKELSPRQYTVLLELCRYRDQIARQLNRPLFKIIGDKTLLSIAQSCPQTLQELKKIPGLSRRQIERYGQCIMKAIQRGLSAPLQYTERPMRPESDFLMRLEALRSWRKETAQAMGVESDVILPRDLLFELAEKNPADLTSLEHILQPVPWRFEHFGNQILKVLKKLQDLQVSQ